MSPEPPNGRPRWVLPATLWVLVVLAVWINVPLPLSRSDRLAGALPPLPPVAASQRVLVISPHPDDETLCCAGLITQALSGGAQVFVVWVTAGDGFEFDAALTERTLHPRGAALRALGERRAAEARHAASLLGIPGANLYFLGYPDGSLRALPRAPGAAPLTSPRTGASAVYLRGALRPGAPFTRESLERDVAHVLDLVQPDLVLVPAPQDAHPDHHTVSDVARRLMEVRGQSGRLRYWVVHGGLEWPVPKGLHVQLPLTVPPRARRLPWQQVELSVPQRVQKLEAVNAYRTQTEVMGRFMRAFVRRSELISPRSSP